MIRAKAGERRANAEGELVLLEGRETELEVSELLTGKPELSDNLVSEGVLDVVELEDLRNG